MKQDYQIGEQPCKEFQSNEPTPMGFQTHECYCKDKDGKYCGLGVAFCGNCTTDHHEKGYENCICKKKVTKR